MTIPKNRQINDFLSTSKSNHKYNTRLQQRKKQDATHHKDLNAKLTTTTLYYTIPYHYTPPNHTNKLNKIMQKYLDINVIV